MKIILSKRELYKIVFPDRIAINSNKHYAKTTRPQLLNILKRRNYEQSNKLINE